ncbi:hypothetical protein [Shimazuella alba]|nr:hypothetical protein [Shimazuella alba]
MRYKEWKRDLNTTAGKHNMFTDHQLILPSLEKDIDVPKIYKMG